ncbi:MAG: TraR/DksA C4-type zinc finger protein [Thermodesulfovibrionales bacterium]|nr:TraR/DksA C4-type zinc finger protein [Thermodesulfovibrionales bacterium]
MAAAKTKKKAAEKPGRKAPAKKQPATGRLKKAVPSGEAKSAKQSNAAKTAGKMTPAGQKLEEIKKKLFLQRETILNEAEVAMNALPDQTVFPDLGDQATVESDRSFMLRLRGRERRLLKKVEEAIDRMDKGTFGICDICGEKIDVKRLMARPVTTMCLNCKTEQEEEEKIQGI